MLITRALRSFASSSTPSSFIRVISERSISRGWDGAVTRAMEGVRSSSFCVCVCAPCKSRVSPRPRVRCFGALCVRALARLGASVREEMLRVGGARSSELCVETGALRRVVQCAPTRVCLVTLSANSRACLLSLPPNPPSHPEYLPPPPHPRYCPPAPAHQVQDRVKQQPGLVTYETLVDTADPDKHVVSTVWESKAHLEAWLADPWYIAKCEEFDELLHDDATYDIFVLPREEQFLL